MTEPTQAPALVENMLLLRREDFDDLLDRALGFTTEDRPVGQLELFGVNA